MDLIKNIEQFLLRNAELFIEVREIGFQPEKWEYVLGYLDMYGFNKIMESYGDAFVINTSAGSVLLYKSGD